MVLTDSKNAVSSPVIAKSARVSIASRFTKLDAAMDFELACLCRRVNLRAEGVVAVLGTGVAFGEVAGKRGGWNEADHRLLRSFSGFGWGGNAEKC